MPVASPPLSRFAATDGLAVARPVVVRSGVPSDSRLEILRRDRLYVICQFGGWVLFTVAYTFLGALQRPMALSDVCVFAATNCVGLLLTHLYRNHINRRGWKQLGWSALLPRVLAATLVLALLWTLSTWPIYTYLYSGHPPGLKFSVTAIFVYSLFNGGWIFSLWSAVYFVYHTFDRARRAEIERWKFEVIAKEAELRALKSQINPHFLFNSLNSLRALIDEDAPRARESVTRLANMLRYSLQSGQQETVLFDDELRIVEDYLALEQIRHEHRLRLRWDIAPAARTQALPPMLLQTLVENAVKYGIGARREGGELAISAQCDEAAGGQPAMLHIRVTNPGNLAVPLQGVAATAEKSTGLGLRNASERLKLLFGDKAVLTLQDDSGGCVTADVRIPIAPPAR
ncbi:MAG: histidine kinase [Opitutae bacterium]|nr:histidine kinase [Opitutae bacterium]